jgi:predicted hotdog family 3-hydroxylacyl-ACP dehydratase
MPTLSKGELSEFLPHAGAMRLIDSVESWDETTIRCRTRSHHDPANPLRRGARLDAVAGLEYAAQAIGVHVGLLTGRPSPDGSIGYVGGLRDVVLGIDSLDGCPADLTIDATRLFADDRSFLYRFAILSEGRTVMSGRVSIFLTQAPP